MTGAARACSDERLCVLLTGEEESAEFRAAAEHVEGCPRCQARLTEVAAPGGEWDQARRLLADDAQEAAIDQERRLRPWSSALLAGKSTIWTETMARQLLAPPSHPEMLGRLGRYEIERLIGSGGMGVVFKGFDMELNRPVAIKVLAPHLAGNGAARQRFAREARAAAAVVHEHVVAIHNVESDGVAPFLVMQFVAGESLQARLDRQGPLAVAEILRIAYQTAAGLAAAHAQGLVHRDVKPSNILLEQGVERALLTDFGLARAADDASLTHTGFLPGTPHYMSPEQARGEAVDAQSDLFSLGSVMYAMCTGRPPFRADTSFGVLRRITDTQPRPIREINPDIPDWFAALIENLHAKDPADRVTSAAELADLLKQCLAHVQQPASVPLPSGVSSARALRAGFAHQGSRAGQARASKRRPTILQFATAAVLIVAALAFFALSQRPESVTSPSGRARLSPSREGDAADAISAASPAGVPPIDGPATDWDASAAEIADLASGVQSLEFRSAQLWDRLPAVTQSTNSSPPIDQDTETLP